MSMVIVRTEQQIITKQHPKWLFINEMCGHTKDLYNYANYLIRQEFTQNRQYIKYREINFNLKSHELYKSCMSQPANCVLRRLDKNWKSFFKAIKDWKEHKEKYNATPKLPKYLKKDGRFVWEIPNNTCYIVGDELHFRIRKLQDIKWRTKAKGRLLQVRFVPRGNDYVMEVVTEVEIEDKPKREISRVIGMDLGVNNFVTITNNIGEQPIIINGKGLKSINQYFNKKRAYLMGRTIHRNKINWSNKLGRLTNKRFNKVKNFMHHASKFVIDYCRLNNIDTIICGLNNLWKQRVKLGSNTQSFIFIPYNVFIKQLTYKCEEAGINFITTDESYTSGTSFLDNEEPIKENYNKKRRIKRGLFKSNNGALINSDVNGSLQIIKKVAPNAFADGVQGYLTPVIINVANAM